MRPYMQRWQCSQWQPSKLCLIKYELDMHILFVQTVYFNWGFLCVPWVPEYLAHFLILSTNGEIRRTKLLSFQGYRCKWGIALLAWKVTWNYAYSPFNGICRFFSLFFRLSMEKVRQVLIENLFPCTILPAVQMLVNNGEIPTNLYRNFLYDCVF